jgi:hypothetical protein
VGAAPLSRLGVLAGFVSVLAGLVSALAVFCATAACGFALVLALVFLPVSAVFGSAAEGPLLAV